MKIAQIAPLYESVPPKFYGGTERVVSYLTEELVRQGHDVTRSPAAIRGRQPSWYVAAIWLFALTRFRWTRCLST